MRVLILVLRTITVSLFTCLIGLTFADTSDDLFAPGGVFAPPKTRWVQETENLETWVITVNSGFNYPPGIVITDTDNPLACHDRNYTDLEFALVRFIQDNGINFLGVPSSRLSLSCQAFESVSRMKTYRYEIVVTSTAKNVEDIFNLVKKFHPVERRKIGVGLLANEKNPLDFDYVK